MIYRIKYIDQNGIENTTGGMNYVNAVNLRDDLKRSETMKFVEMWREK